MLLCCRSGECPSALRSNFQAWFAIHSTLRPLCASLMRNLDQRGAIASAKELANLEDEALRFRVRKGGWALKYSIVYSEGKDVFRALFFGGLA